MPANQPVKVVPAGFADITMYFRIAGLVKTYSIGMGVGLTAVDIAGLTAAAAAVRSTFITNLIGKLDDDVSIVRVVGRGSPDDGNLLVEINTITPGTADIASLPANTAVLVEKTSAMAGRQNRGRMFAPFMVDEVNVGGDGAIVEATLEDLDDSFGSWHAAIEGNAAITNVVLFHSDFIRNPAVPHDEPENPAYRIANPDADTPTVVADFTVDPVVATQRRRLR